MNSNERVKQVFKGEIPDRVPIGEFAIDFDTIEKIIGRPTYVRAKAKSKIAFWENRHEEVIDSYIKDHIELHEKLGFDIINFPMATWAIPLPNDDPPPTKLDENTWQDKVGRIFKYSDITHDVVCVDDPLAEQTLYTMDHETLARVDEVEKGDINCKPAGLDERSWDILDQVIGHFAGRKFIVGPSGGEIGIVLEGGMEHGMMALIRNRDFIDRATRFLVDKQNALDKKMVHPKSDAVIWGADFAHSRGGFISPIMFREMFFSANKTRLEHIKKNHGKIVVKHCCGNVNKFLDIFAELGYDCYQSIQQSGGMDLAEVKQRIGDKMVLWGGVPVEFIIDGTMAEVRQAVRQAMHDAKDNGRFILGTTHSIAVGSNYDNFMAMVDEYWQHCAY
ncbi:MAG: hypothetical protein HKP41_03545 [Desulfobacterales bacterium]|nr:hypothetical protein [Deltaproteobacteria bacterium]NNK93405.1 hypothetical protein [Desulfobacterales bacterium]